MTCLNPCCSGQWSSTKGELNKNVADYVLILVVVEDGLVLRNGERRYSVRQS